MAWQFTVLALPTLFALGVSVVLFGYVLLIYRDRRDDSVIALYFWSIVAATVWTGFSALKLLHTDLATKLLFYRLLHVGAAVLPPLLFLFVVAFTDRTRWLGPRSVGAVFFLPAVFLLLLFFGPDGVVVGGTRLFEDGPVVLRVEDGPGFLLLILYSVSLVVATLGVVLRESRRVGRVYYPQAALIVVAVVAPMLVSVLTTAGVSPLADVRVNLVPTSAAVSVLSFGVLLFRYRLVDLPPLAYATAMRYSPDALFVLDRERVVVSTNDSGGELLTALDGAPGASLSDAVPGFDPESTTGELVETESPAGDTTYHRVFVEPLTRGGRRVGWIVVLRDETRQQRQQRRLRQQNEQMELFASAISHDLRNPLSVASGYLELAREDVDSEELDRVDRSLTRMEEIIEDLLTLARAGERIDEVEPVSVSLDARQAWENVATETATLAVESDRTFLADPGLVHHVFENLFRNAVEHGSPEGNPESDDTATGGGDGVTVTVGALDGGFYLEDDGTGIPPDERADVFDVGYTTASDGTGFGLNIVRGIVTAHGWEIRLTEGTDGGARFEITGVEEAES